MYVLVVQMGLGVAGFIMGFASRFLIELIWEVVLMCKHLPLEAKRLPSLAELRNGILPKAYFSLVFVLGFSVELIIYETVPIILFQSQNPSANIALWMSMYQIIDLRKDSIRIRGLAGSVTLSVLYRVRLEHQVAVVGVVPNRKARQMRSLRHNLDQHQVLPDHRADDVGGFARAETAGGDSVLH